MEYILACQYSNGSWRVITVQPSRELALTYLKKARRRPGAVSIVLCEKTENGLQIVEAYGLHTDPESSTVIFHQERKTSLLIEKKEVSGEQSSAVSP